MLRSRKKQVEKNVKKSNDAISRHSPKTTNVSVVEQATADIVIIPEIAEQAFSPDIIDPAKVRLANQVDKWANMIDSMALTGRLRQLAIHATIDEASTDECLQLRLDQSIKHFNSDAAHQQLAEQLSKFLQRQIKVQVTLVNETVADPYQIQSQIDGKRYDYAKSLLLADEIVVQLQDKLQATMHENTIVAC